jgi:hypothetical protein
MWYYSFVVRTRVRLTALQASSHPLGSPKKSPNSNHCRTSRIFARNSFTCHTYKTKNLKPFLCHTYEKSKSLPPVMVNRLPA